MIIGNGNFTYTRSADTSQIDTFILPRPDLGTQIDSNDISQDSSAKIVIAENTDFVNSLFNTTNVRTDDNNEAVKDEHVSKFIKPIIVIGLSLSSVFMNYSNLPIKSYPAYIESQTDHSFCLPSDNVDSVYTLYPEISASCTVPFIPKGRQSQETEKRQSFIMKSLRGITKNMSYSEALNKLVYIPYLCIFLATSICGCVLLVLFLIWRFSLLNISIDSQKIFFWILMCFGWAITAFTGMKCSKRKIHDHEKK